MDILTESERIGRGVASTWADDVDVRARFPVETVDEIRRAGLLATLVPEDAGGAGASLAEASRSVAAISAHCGSSGMILAMHHLQVAAIVRHGSPAMQEKVYPLLITGDLLLANANSEVGLAGERRISNCALEPVEGGYHLDKHATTVSYGEHADGVLATARRTPTSPGNEQVMAVCLPPALHLTPEGEWDTLGLRGTCSLPAHLVADVPADMVLDDYPSVFVRTGLAHSAILLSSVWLGLAEGAAQRAHATVRAKARANRSAGPGEAPPLGAIRLAELGVQLHQLREVIAGGAERYERAKDTEETDTLRFSGVMDYIKLSSSTLVLDILQRAMGICGLEGYKNSTRTSLARMLRDANAAPLMVNNDRTLQASAQALLIRKEI
ncbi:MAG: acyl-CoA dehydrogenase family protein [Acidimicrobiales bacterium]|jgi:acyl-CoA dehydrogenase